MIIGLILGIIIAVMVYLYVNGTGYDKDYHE